MPAFIFTPAVLVNHNLQQLKSTMEMKIHLLCKYINQKIIKCVENTKLSPLEKGVLLTKADEKYTKIFDWNNVKFLQYDKYW